MNFKFCVLISRTALCEQNFHTFKKIQLLSQHAYSLLLSWVRVYAKRPIFYTTDDAQLHCIIIFVHGAIPIHQTSFNLILGGSCYIEG